MAQIVELVRRARARIATAGLCAALLATVAALAGSAGATFPGHNGRIAFGSARTGSFEIFSMKPSGKGVRRLTHNSKDDFSPSYSPNAKRIAFVNEPSPTTNDEIRIMNANGTHNHALTHTPTAFDDDPSFGPKGKIAFDSDRNGGTSQIFVMGADGKHQHALTHASSNSFEPGYSPTGRKIAFTRFLNGNLEVFVMRSDGTHQRNLTKNTAGDSDPQFSPNGKKILFESNRTGPGDLFVMRADGSHVRDLTPNAGVDVVGAYSPNGKRIVFESSRSGNDDIYVMNANGTHQHRLTKNPALETDPDWGVG
jgi:Tol biopolymer transport system component